MILLDISNGTSNNTTVVICSLITAFTAIIIAILTAHKKDMDKIFSRFDKVDDELSPIVTQLAVHSEQIKNINEKLLEHDKWIGVNNGEIQKIQRSLKTA